MRILFPVSLTAILLIGTSSASAVVEGTMKGVIYGTGGTCSGAISSCKKNFPKAAAQCTSAGAACMQTGVFTSPAGKSFSGLKKQ